MRASLEQIHARLEVGVQQLVSSGQWVAMLRVAARFHNYSFNNQLLIYAQRPDATRVAGYRTWQSLGRQVRRGERGIAILAPCKRTKTIELEDEDELQRLTVLTGFRVAHVFDISQTEGQELPEVAPVRLTGDASAALLDALEARLAGEGFSLRRAKLTRPRLYGYADLDARRVVLRDDISDAQSAKTLIHELAHVLLHQDGDADPEVAEVEAESVAFVVCTALGLDSSDYSFPYVARWGAGHLDVIAATAQRVVSCARDILDCLD